MSNHFSPHILRRRRGRVVELATNCYGTHVLQKALDCDDETRVCDIIVCVVADFVKYLIVSELLQGDPAATLINKHASHVFSKVSNVSSQLLPLTISTDYGAQVGRRDPTAYLHLVRRALFCSTRLNRCSFNHALRGKWASLACHETGSLVVQTVFENVEEDSKGEIIAEILASFPDVVKSQWGAFCIQHCEQPLSIDAGSADVS